MLVHSFTLASRKTAAIAWRAARVRARGGSFAVLICTFPHNDRPRNAYTMARRYSARWEVHSRADAWTCTRAGYWEWRALFVKMERTPAARRDAVAYLRQLRARGMTGGGLA
jgi:hypothetical protein